MKKDYDIVIIGAGVIGLSIAFSLLKSKKNILVIEKNESFGREISSRNSEVIHSGIYYPENSLKHSLCTRGRNLLYDFCKEHNIWFNKCGKLIIAQKSELNVLEDLYNQSITNEIDNTFEIDKSKIQKMCPHISAYAGIYLGCTGIFSSHDFMSKLYHISSSNDHDYLFKASVVGADIIPSGYELTLKNSDDDFETVTCETVINCAGLNSDIIGALPMTKDSKIPQISFLKGCYFKLSSKWRNEFDSLIYPVPDKKNQTLGIHLTIDKDRNARLGPNAKYLDYEDYSVDDSLKNEFYNAARVYLPNLKESDLYPDYSGIRPKIKSRDKKFNDFYISDEKNKGLSRWFNLIGIESPGLTSSLAIGEKVVEML